MRYTFSITDNSTGEARAYQDTFDWEDEDLMLFNYTEGNYACDCNRHLFFRRAAGEPEPELDDAPCGSERFSIPRAVREDGTVLDIDEPAQHS